MDFILVLLSTVLLAVDFSISKKYQMEEGVALRAGLRFNALLGLFTALVFFALSGFRFYFSLFSLLMSFCMALCTVIYSILGFRVLKTENMAVYSLFLMCGGMLLPYLFGVLFLNESISVGRVAGLGLILLAIVLTNNSRAKMKKTLFLCVLIFVLNGLVSIISKCHQIAPQYSPVDSTAFVMYTGIGKFLFSSIALWFVKQPQPRRQPFWQTKSFWLIPASAFVGGLSYFLQLTGAKSLPATVLYPLITGGSIVFSSGSAALFFGQKPSRRQWLSVGLCLAGTLLFL